MHSRENRNWKCHDKTSVNQKNNTTHREKQISTKQTAEMKLAGKTSQLQFKSEVWQDRVQRANETNVNTGFSSQANVLPAAVNKPLRATSTDFKIFRPTREKGQK